MCDNNRIEVRRLNIDELSLILGLQKEARDLLIYYNELEHDHWLKRAIIDIREGTRVALGAFITNESNTHIAGSAILKRGSRQRHVQLKNFIVSNLNGKNIDKQNEIRQIMLRSIERFCSVRGFSSIEIEFPADLTSHIAFFLKNQFRVSDVRQSRYREMDYHYVLEKQLDRMYNGDPFDDLTMSRWLVYEFFQFPRIYDASIDRVKLQDSEEIENSFTFRVAPNSEIINKDLSLTGACIFETPCNQLDQAEVTAFSKTNYDLKLFVTRRRLSDYSEITLQSPGVRIIGPEFISATFGEQSPTNVMRLEQNQICGLLLVVGSNFRQRICAQKGDYYYVLGSGLGHILNTSPDVENERTIAVFCSEHISEDGTVDLFLWGYSTILNFNMLSPESVEEFKENDIGRVWTESELDYYLTDEFTVNNNEYKRVSIIKLATPFILEQELSAYSSDVISESVTTFLKTYEKYGVSSCYLDKDSTIQIMNLQRRETISTNIGDEVMLDSLIDAVESLGSFSTVSANAVKEIRRLVDALRSATEPNDMTDPRISAIVVVVQKELDDLIAQYGKIRSAVQYNDIDKDMYVAKISAKAANLLEAAKPIKEQIAEYDALVDIFTHFSVSFRK